MARASSIGCGIAAALTCLATAAPAQAPKPRPTPPPTGPGSVEGVWNNAGFKDYRTGPPVGATAEMKTATGEPIPMRPETAAIVAKRLADVREGKPFAGNSSQCITDGMPGATSTPAQLPLQILENKGQVTFLYEFFSTFRIIRMNAKHKDDPDPTYMGDAVGHWEGGTLVVDTIGISDNTEVMNLIPHSDQLHVIERIRRTGPDTMENRVTIDDPKNFTRPWEMAPKLFRRIAGMELAEYVCDNNRNVVDDKGATGVQLKGNP